MPTDWRGADPSAERERREQRSPDRGLGSRAAGAAYGYGRSFLSQTAATATGVALGTSLTGLPLTAINTYMQLSKVITQVGARFRDAAEGQELFSTKMGYGIARSAQISEALGKVMNTFDGATGVRYAGFARHTGMDPEEAMSKLGRISELRGRDLSNTDLARLLGVARDQGMDQGRLGEFLDRVQQQTTAMFQATGRINMNEATVMADLPSMVYGKGSTRAANDETLMSGLNATMTSGGPMKSYMLRAMGFGRKGGPDYMEAMERLDAGAYDRQNLVDLFGSMVGNGMGKETMFSALHSLDGGLKAYQIRALVDRFGSAEGVDDLRNMGSGSEGLKSFIDRLTPDERQAFGRGGFGASETYTNEYGEQRRRTVGLGSREISAGESYENTKESIYMSVGAQLAPSIPNLQKTIMHIGGMMEKFLNTDIGGLLERLTGSIERATAWGERNMKPWNEGGPMAGFMPGYDAAQNSWGRVRARGSADGVVAGIMEGVESGLEFWTGDDYNLSGGYDLTRPRAGSGPR